FDETAESEYINLISNCINWVPSAVEQVWQARSREWDAYPTAAIETMQFELLRTVDRLRSKLVCDTEKFHTVEPYTMQSILDHLHKIRPLVENLTYRFAVIGRMKVLNII